jgi:hypothetical protein
MIETLLGDAFTWTGKGQVPLIGTENKRYLDNIMAKAVSSWKLPKNAPNNLDKRKNLFWNAVKNRTLYYSKNANSIPVNIVVSEYNKSGKKFKRSNLSNTLQYK